MPTLGKNEPTFMEALGAEVNDPAILRAELRGVREQRDLFADRLFRVRAEHGELRDALRRADNILRGLDATGAYAAGAGEQVAKLLKNIPAPDVTLAGKAFPG